jgi:hypothetical protein
MTATAPSRLAIAQGFLAAFETRKRDNGDEFLCLADGSPDWMSEAVRLAHGDMLPEDIRYRMVKDMLGAIVDVLETEPEAAEADLYATAEERIDGLISPYTADRTAWLASSIQRPGYVDEANEFYGNEGAPIVEQIERGMIFEYREICPVLVAAIRTQAGESE